MFFKKHLHKYILMSSLLVSTFMLPKIPYLNLSSDVYASKIQALETNPNTGTDTRENPGAGTDSDPNQTENNPESNTTDPEKTTLPSSEEKEPTSPVTPSTEASTEEKEPAPKPVQKKRPSFTGNKQYSVKYKKGGTFSLNIKSNSDGNFTYSSSNSKVATVSKKGKVTMKGIGTCKITITAKETEKYLPSNVKATITIWKQPKKLGYSFSYRRSKYYKKLMNLKLSASARENLLSIAKSQLGYHEGPSKYSLSGASKSNGNYTEYSRFYGMNGVPWCAIFVNWVARENGISYKVVPKECAVRLYYSFYQRKHLAYSWERVRTKKRKPQKGDIIFYSYSYRATTHHIGYVNSCKYSGKKIILNVVEGNQKNKVNALKMTLSTSNKTGRINGRGMYITGFASPKY